MRVVSTPPPHVIFCADAREAEDFRQIRTFSILLGAMFLGAAIIELLGVASCFTVSVSSPDAKTKAEQHFSNDSQSSASMHLDLFFLPC